MVNTVSPEPSTEEQGQVSQLFNPEDTIAPQKTLKRFSISLDELLA
jgi:hypothetical protein